MKLLILLFLVPTIAFADKCNDEYQRLTSKEGEILKSYNKQPQKAHKQLIGLASEIESAVLSCAKSAKLNSLMALVQITLGENGLAIKYAEKALSQDSNSWEANNAYGTALSLNGQENKGLFYLEKSVDLAPLNTNLLINLCSSYESAGKYNKAIIYCGRAIKLNDANVNGSAHYIRARAYNAINNTELAQQDFSKAKELGFEGSKFYSEEHYAK